MSVLIKGMEMPNVCDECWALDESGDYPMCRITGATRGYNFPVRKERMDRCPLIELPDHGDLIDRDEAVDDACLIWGRNSSGDDATQEIIEHLRKMNAAVIPAERSEE